MSLRELRLRKVHAEVIRNGSFRVDEGARALDVSPETIRRDLEQLSRLGLVVRTRGGAVAPGVALTEVHFNLRQREHAHEKMAIARAAVDTLIADQGSLALDTGSTTLEVARLLQGYRLNVITNSLPIVQELAGSHCTVIMLGGVVRDRSMSTVGPLTETGAREFHCDLALISAPAISAELGLMDTDVEAVAAKRALMRSAARRYAVLDHSKFGRTAFTTICSLDELTGLVTDAALAPERLAEYREAGLDVIAAQRDQLVESSESAGGTH